MDNAYVHGYSGQESARLNDQASTLVDLLHRDTSYPPGSRVLEAGCGVGAQTITLARNSPGAQIVSLDISATSLAVAEQRLAATGATNVTFRQGDVYGLPFADGSFDHVFVCFVLEHLARPDAALAEALRVVVPGGTITVIEGDHGSALFHPDSAAAHRAIDCLIDLQRRAGGDSLIGRRLYPLLAAAGVEDLRVSPRVAYADASLPAMVDGFIRKTFTAMVEGVGEQAVAEGLIPADAWTEGIAALYRTAEADGTFSYTFYKAVGRRPARAAAEEQAQA
jgi:SAM-dependent methyltransferase